MRARTAATMRGSSCCLWLATVAMTLLMMTEMTSAYSTFCDKPANMGICYPSLSKRFLRFGRALTDDHFLRFGRGGGDMEKRFLRFGRSDADAALEDMLRLAIARAEADDGGLYVRKRRSTSEQAPHEDPTAKAIATSDHPEGVAKREAGDSALPLEEEEKRFMRFGRGSGGEDGDGMRDDKRFMRFGKRFMRFGRGDEEEDEDDADAATAPREAKRFMRFGKRFMRFGRGSQDEDDDALSEEKRFMRFGKRFMRFGRDPAEGYEDEDKDKRFMRFGKRFMRFGRGGAEEEEEEEDEGLPADKRFMRFGKRFMRFGREPLEAEKRFMRFGRSDQSADDAAAGKADDKRFMRFGKRFMRFGKRFMRFGKSGKAEESKSEQSSS